MLRRLTVLLAGSLAALACFAGTNVIELTYDADGNITNLARQGPLNGFAVTGFDPASGPVGSSVTVYGTGFSATPASNAVTINGVAATVSAATTGSLSVTVPTGGSTGRIAVTVGANTATSAQDFVVTVPGAPTIASFTPASGAAGSTISVTGANFDASPVTVKLNGVTATSTVASATALTFTVPGAAASGRITAANSVGTGTSPTDFIVPPSGYSAADFAVITRVGPGDPNRNVVIGTAGKNALVLFDASAGGWYTFQLFSLQTSPTNAAIAYKVIAPDNTVLLSGTTGIPYVPTIHLPQLAASGTYSLILGPGTATLNANLRLAVDPTIVVDGASIASALDAPGQSQRFVFAATAGQRIGIGASGFTFVPATASVSITPHKPDGSNLPAIPCSAASTSNPQGNCGADLVAPVDGTYTLTADHSPTAYSNFSIQMSSPATATLVVDTPATIGLTRLGQVAQLSFTGTAGDSVALDVSGVAQTPQAQPLSVTILGPTGTTLTSCTVQPPANGYCELGVLAASGTYTVIMDPGYAAYGSFNVTLKKGTTIAANDPPAAFAPAGTTESARFMFSGTAGQTPSIAVADLVHVGSGSPTTLTLFRPDRSSITSTNCFPGPGGDCRLPISSLPTTGVYSIAVRPPANVRISGNVVVSTALTGVLVSGTPQAIPQTVPGQFLKYTFSGTAGDSAWVKLYGVTTTPASQSLSLTVFKPDGSVLGSASTGPGTAGYVNMGNLPVTGTYTVTVDASGSSWQGTLALDPGTLAAIDGSTGTLATTVAGEPLRVRFSGTAGQRVDFGLWGLSYASGTGGTSYWLYRPDNTFVIGTNCIISTTAGCEFTSTSLPLTGTYVLMFVPPNVSINGGTYAISTPLAGTFVVADPPQTVAITRPGQVAKYTFSGTSGQLLRLNWSSATVQGTNSVAVSVLKPDGTTLSSSSFVNGATGGMDVASLPSTGTYTVMLDPSSAATMSASMNLATR